MIHVGEIYPGRVENIVGRARTDDQGLCSESLDCSIPRRTFRRRLRSSRLLPLDLCARRASRTPRTRGGRGRSHSGRLSRGSKPFTGRTPSWRFHQRGIHGHGTRGRAGRSHSDLGAVRLDRSGWKRAHGIVRTQCQRSGFLHRPQFARHGDGERAPGDGSPWSALVRGGGARGGNSGESCRPCRGRPPRLSSFALEKTAVVSRKTVWIGIPFDSEEPAVGASWGVPIPRDGCPCGVWTSDVIESLPVAGRASLQRRENSSTSAPSTSPIEP